MRNMCFIFYRFAQVGVKILFLNKQADVICNCFTVLEVDGSAILEAAIDHYDKSGLDIKANIDFCMCNPPFFDTGKCGIATFWCTVVCS